MKLFRKSFLIVLLSFLGMFSVQAQGLKISSPHPNLKVRITGCEGVGNDVVITLLLENTEGRDMNVQLEGGFDKHSMAIDDEGNQYSEYLIQVKIGNGYYSQMSTYDKFYSGVPMKATIKIGDVPEHVKSFARLNLQVTSNDWGIYDHIKISNIPISREGDE